VPPTTHPKRIPQQEQNPCRWVAAKQERKGKDGRREEVVNMLKVY
jgi:hypothetical protein